MVKNKRHNHFENEEVLESVELNNEEVEMEEAEEVMYEVRIRNGVVTANGKKLNVRSQATKQSDVVCVIDDGTEVTVISCEPTNGFYKVNVNGLEGFCMQEFITIK